MDDRAAIPLDAETKVAERPADHEAELRLWLRLLTCTTLIEGEVRRRLRDDFDVTLPRFDLMAQLDKAPNGMTLGELSQRMMVSNGNVTGSPNASSSRACSTAAPRRPTGARRSSASRPRAAARSARWRARMRTGSRRFSARLAPDEIETLMRLLAKTKASARKAVTEREAS